MRVGIIDADLLDHGTRHPNLALMKISGYLRSQGNDTQLILDHDIAEFSSHQDMLSSFDKVGLRFLISASYHAIIQSDLLLVDALGNANFV